MAWCCGGHGGPVIGGGVFCVVVCIGICSCGVVFYILVVKKAAYAYGFGN